MDWLAAHSLLLWMFRQGRTIFQRGREMAGGTTAIVVFVGCAASELAQPFDLCPGVYDPADLAAFAISVLVCYGLDRTFGLGR